MDHISDSFLETNVPLLVLIEAAKSGNEKEVKEYAQVFREHANKLVEVSHELNTGAQSHTYTCSLILLLYIKWRVARKKYRKFITLHFTFKWKSEQANCNWTCNNLKNVEVGFFLPFHFPRNKLLDWKEYSVY